MAKTVTLTNKDVRRITEFYFSLPSRLKVGPKLRCFLPLNGEANAIFIYVHLGYILAKKSIISPALIFGGTTLAERDTWEFWRSL